MTSYLPSLTTLLLVLPPSLLIYTISLLIHRHSPVSPPTSDNQHPSLLESPLPSLLLPLTTTHLRLLPTPARHAFRYPLLYFGLDLASLESHSLTRTVSWYPSWARGWGLRLAVFGYESQAESRGEGRGRKGWSVTGLGEESYLTPTDPSDSGTYGREAKESMNEGESRKEETLDDTSPSSPSPIDPHPLRTKMEHLLSDHLSKSLEEVSCRLGSVYLITMPAFLGKEGINPLSVWFCYESCIGGRDSKQEMADSSERKLWVVILEVHNTFGERHVYVLEVGKGEDASPPIG